MNNNLAKEILKLKKKFPEAYDCKIINDFVEEYKQDQIKVKIYDYANDCLMSFYETIKYRESLHIKLKRSGSSYVCHKVSTKQDNDLQEFLDMINEELLSDEKFHNLIFGKDFRKILNKIENKISYDDWSGEVDISELLKNPEQFIKDISYLDKIVKQAPSIINIHINYNIEFGPCSTIDTKTASCKHDIPLNNNEKDKYSRYIMKYFKNMCIDGLHTLMDSYENSIICSEITEYVKNNVANWIKESPKSITEHLNEDIFFDHIVEVLP